MKNSAPSRRLRAVVPQTKPIGGLLDPRFIYVRSEHTDIRKTFERIRAAGPLVKGKP